MGSFIAGPYKVSAGSGTPFLNNLTDLGCIEEGFTLEITPSVDPIRCDSYGDAIVDGVYRAGNMYLDFVLNEAEKDAVQSIFWPFGTLGEVGVPGKLLSDFSQNLQLEAVSGTAAASGDFNYISTTAAILAPNYPLRILFSSRLRNIPIRLQLLPFEYSTTKYFFRPVNDPTAAA